MRSTAVVSNPRSGVKKVAVAVSVRGDHKGIDPEWMAYHEFEMEDQIAWSRSILPYRWMKSRLISE